jgi:signal transduction histidine kinase/ActR/RegA family two-component response regulator
MTGFQEFPIRRKLVVIGLLTVGLALFLQSSVSLVSTFAIMRQSVQDDLLAQTTIIADNAEAAVGFEDLRAAEETLASLADKTNVDLACLFTADGRPFAHYQRAGAGATCPAQPPPDGTLRQLNSVEHIAPMSIAGRRVGTVYLQGNHNQIWGQLRAQMIGAGVGLIASALGALLLMSRLHRTLVEPLSHLSSVAARVSANHDYALRATKYTNDEIGALVDAFNDMLARVQAREAELSKVNIDLSREIVERQRMENERTVLLERERQANRLKDEFLATLSHELRTPLNAILGWAQVLEQPSVAKDTAAHGLASIHRNARAQTRLIDDLLDISRIVSGKFVLNLQTVDVNAVVAASVEVVKPSAAVKSIALDVALPPVACAVSADPDRLQQVLWNLLSNAIKFTPADGKVCVTVRTDGETATIDVRDTGIGIAPEFLPHVFDRFRQADGSMTREHGGLGLGLAIAHEIVGMHGGSIVASSGGRGTGATFSVRLPLAKLAHSAEPTRHATLSPDLLAGVRILVVDDDPDAREIAKTALTAAGAIVVTASTPNDALERVLEPPGFAVLVCDVGMPGMDGYETLKRFHERERPEGRFTPAVAMTAHATAADVARAKAAGFGWHVAKPVLVPALLQAVLSAAAAGAQKSTPPNTSIH